MYGYGLSGNCQIAALVSDEGSLDWLCMPRPDSPPVFVRILDEDGGHFTVIPRDPISGKHQEYVRNTNVLTTTVTTKGGDSYRITDFCPRFYQFNRIFRPFSVYRVIEPLTVNPMVRMVCSPVNGWEKKKLSPARGNSHLRYDIRGETMRVWTNMPMTYLCEGRDFPLRERVVFALTWSTNLEHDVSEVADQFLTKTVAYWRQWVSHCSVPAEFQSEVIRSALALKLHCYEDTGAILAALTNSLP